MYVNDVDLGHASLDDAVQALKGAQRGIVRIGVSKSIPVPESEQEVEEEETHTRTSVSENTEIRSEGSELNTPEHEGNGSTTLETLPELPPDDAIPPPLPTSPPPADDHDSKKK